MASPRTQIRSQFPKLGDQSTFNVTSPPDTKYNCIAWAACDDKDVWWPHATYGRWPAEVPRAATVENFVKVFELLGYELCESGILEEGWEKVALYATAGGEPKHMARQLEDGSWTSKLGLLWDIKHKSVIGLEGARYGNVIRYLRKKIPAKK